MSATRVLVTGGSGFIGGWCVLAALGAGHDVRTTVRDPRKGDALRRQLHAAAAFDDSRLTVVRADLQSDDGWADAAEGCDYVLHVASPTLRTGDISEADMIATARDGVLRVLRAARDTGVRRVVLTIRRRSGRSAACWTAVCPCARRSAPDGSTCGTSPTCTCAP